MKNIFAGIIFISLVGCGSASDPGTEGKADLTPAYDLHTVTKDAAIELRWSAQNAEDDVQGYYVFGRKLSAASEAAVTAGSAKYPTSVNVSETGIPRCVSNSDLLKTFSTALVSTKDCTGDTSSAGSTASLVDGPQMLADSSTTTTETLTGFLTCAENTTDTTISIVGKTPILTLQKCTVSKIGTTALENGSLYEFFVFAVKGTKKNKISWTSNFVVDSPSKTAVDSQSVTLATDQLIAITLTPATGAATVATAVACSTHATNANACKLNDDVTGGADNQIYIGRESGTSRIFISADKNKNVKVRLRGNQTKDPTSSTSVTRAPRDQAAASFDDLGGVHKFNVGNDTVVDFEITSGTSKYYGKLVIESITYATATDATSSATLKVSVIMQPTAGLKYYERL